MSGAILLLLIDATLLITVNDTTAVVRSISVLALDQEVVISTACYCCHCQSAPLLTHGAYPCKSLVFDSGCCCSLPLVLTAV